jgi:uncharacterized coiled-coil protein SlyX
MKNIIKNPPASELSHSEKNVLITMLQEQNLLLREKIKRLEKKLRDVEGRLNKDSKNSSKPPSSDKNKTCDI